MGSMQSLFQELLHAGTEGAVTTILDRSGYLEYDPENWQPLGDKENHFGIVANQQSNPTGALVEKIINGVDALLIAACLNSGIDPESEDAPRTMAEAAERFFQIRRGRLENLTARERTALAENLQLVAVGSKSLPNYLVVDTGEGQTPANFPKTFLSLGESNKMRIAFVQGRFNAGGTGVFQFCGDHNYQLIVSRRQPGLPVMDNDNTKDLWGFTFVRRVRPSGTRRNSIYVYLCPNGRIPSFRAKSISVLPRMSKAGKPPSPYQQSIEWGTCIKLYSYKWRAHSIATTESRYELEKHLHTLSHPFRITETRDYKAHYFSTTLSGSSVTIAEDPKILEVGFPSDGSLHVDRVGDLPVTVVVYQPTESRGESTGKRRNPHGILFTVNGQVHAQLSADFVSRRLGFRYIARDLMVTIDCTGMSQQVKEDFFMASRDRVRSCEEYELVEEALETHLKEHPGLRSLNAQRRQKQLESTLTEDEPISVLQNLVKADPTLAALLSDGTRISNPFAPKETQKPYVGMRFPTYFRIHREPKEGLVKSCPTNRSCRVEFETDAENAYFNRGESPGKITFSPEGICERFSLWNGRVQATFRAPANASAGDTVLVRVEVTDESRVDPLVCTFNIDVCPAPPAKPPGPRPPGTPRKPKGAAQLSMPEIREVHKEQWDVHGFDKYSGAKIVPTENQAFDIYINMDNVFLLNELKRETDGNQHQVLRYWFKYGLALAIIGLMQEQKRRARLSNGSQEEKTETEESETTNEAGDVGSVEKITSGLSMVIVPIIRRLSAGPLAASR
ncbi:hypothetical protein MYX77_10060 [Acidobacteriia bacterium AH_259_A11_L15]|nr:hypothetical protein [Acidobacteriia bacterium AH_259_A11_L15]